MIRVIVAEDHTIVREGIKQLIGLAKDMQVIGDYARQIKVPTPLFNATKPVYRKAEASGFGAQDTAAVCAVLEKQAKVKRKRR